MNVGKGFSGRSFFILLFLFLDYLFFISSRLSFGTGVELRQTEFL